MTGDPHDDRTAIAVMATRLTVGVVVMGVRRGPGSPFMSLCLRWPFYSMTGKSVAADRMAAKTDGNALPAARSCVLHAL